jgi:deazaflavin-dependent oxidoreductase (nitroreductase family)
VIGAAADTQREASRMHIPDFMRRVNRVVTNPVLGTVAWIVPPFAVVHHVGRRSGRRYHTPVVAFRTATNFVIPMTYGRDVDWARNLLAARGGEIMQIGRTYPLHNPRIVGSVAAYPHLPPGVRTVLRAADLPGFVLADLERPSRRRRAPRSR